jgi:putative ABC transport system permease protein
MTLTLVKLAFAGVRARGLASALTILLAGAATATLVLALEVGGTARDPWQRTFAAAHGAHVLAMVPSQADARAIARLPGVAEREEAIPSANVPADDGTDRLFVFGLRGAPRVNTPLRTAGEAPPAAGVVLERSFADAVGLRVGSLLRVAGHPLRVSGTAILPSQARYPRSNPGLAWVSRAALARIQPDRGQWHWTQAVRLTDPAAAPGFAARAAATLPPGVAAVATWQDQRAEALREAEPLQIILTTYTILLLAVVFAVVAILIGARAAAQRREIGLLKAVGLTPRQVAAVFTLESAALGLIAVVVGFVAGTLLAPRLAAPGFETLVGAPAVETSPSHLLLAACPVLAALVAGAWSSTRRSTRFTVLQAIESGTAGTARRSGVARAIARLPLPVPLAVGLNDLLARRHRARRLGGAIAVTGAAIVSALSMQATLDAQAAGETSDVPNELPVLVYTLDVVLLVITVTTLVAIALLSVRERTRDYGVLKTVGLTPGQIGASLVGAHAAVALCAAVLAIPIGIALYRGVYAASGGDSGDLVIAPWWWLACVPLGMLLIVATATGLPARLATRIPSAEALRYE